MTECVSYLQQYVVFVGIQPEHISCCDSEPEDKSAAYSETLAEACRSLVIKKTFEY